MHAVHLQYARKSAKMHFKGVVLRVRSTELKGWQPCVNPKTWPKDDYPELVDAIMCYGESCFHDCICLTQAGWKP